MGQVENEQITFIGRKWLVTSCPMRSIKRPKMVFGLCIFGHARIHSVRVYFRTCHQYQGNEHAIVERIRSFWLHTSQSCPNRGSLCEASRHYHLYILSIEEPESEESTGICLESIKYTKTV